MRMTRWMIALGLWLAVGQPAGAQAVQFGLDPPLDTPWGLEMTVTAELPGDDATAEPVYREVHEKRWKMVVTERAGQRWVSVTLVRSGLMVQGQPAPNPTAAAFLGQAVELGLDPQGAVTAIEGLEVLADRLRHALGESAPSAEALEGLYRANWESALGLLWHRLAGRTASVGVPWTQSDMLRLINPPGGAAASAEGQWTLLGSVTPAVGSPTRLRFAYATDVLSPDEQEQRRLQAWLSERIPRLAARSWSTIQWTETGELVVDPKTLMIAESRRVQVVTFAGEASTPPVQLHLISTARTTGSH